MTLQIELPAKENFAELLSAAKDIAAENTRLRHAMGNILTMIDGRVDVEDNGEGGTEPNIFMSIQMEIDRAIPEGSVER